MSNSAHVLLFTNPFVTFYPKDCSQVRGSGSIMFYENASASDSSKSQMLPSSLPLPASFFKVLPLPQKLNRFRFHIPDLKSVIVKPGGEASPPTFSPRMLLFPNFFMTQSQSLLSSSVFFIFSTT